MVKQIVNSILVGILIFLSHLPFWILYGISDFFYLIFRYVTKYRYKVITENLNYAFPKKTEKEIAQIRNKYYRNMCDLAIEAIKLYNMSETQLKKRLIIKGADVINNYYFKEESVIVFAFHYNNWEWCSYLQTQIEQLALMVHNPLRGNKPMERFLQHSRGQWGGECVPINQTARTAMKYIKEERLTLLWLAADQSAPANSKYWTLFLNREAPFFSGPVKLANKTNQPILFQHVKKLKRGKYEVDFSILIEEPGKVDPEDILLEYVRKMEQLIKEEPEYYLWSHRRWKHARPEGVSLTG